MPTKINSVKIRFEKVLGETDRAVLLRFHNFESWLPKKLCRNIVTNNKLAGHCSIPAWLYERIFNQVPNEADATETIEHHIPVRINPNNIDADESLIR